MPSTWYPYIPTAGGVRGKGPGWKPGYELQGDYNALFTPGAKWDPSRVRVLLLDVVDINSTNPRAKQIAEWSKAHPGVEIGLVLSMLTVGPDSHCVGAGGRFFPPRGASLLKSEEGVEFHSNFSTPAWDYSRQAMNAINGWKAMGARIDIILMDTPLSAGIGKCSFSVPQTVTFIVPLAERILSVYPDIQFSLEQGPAGWTDDEWIRYSLDLFREFPRQIRGPGAHQGVRISYANLDVHLDGDIRVPPTPCYTTDGSVGTINRAVEAFRAAGVNVGVNINSVPRPGETQEDVIRRLYAYLRQAIASNVPFGHVSLAPFATSHKPDWTLLNLPSSVPSSLTWLLEQQY